MKSFLIRDILSGPGSPGVAAAAVAAAAGVNVDHNLANHHHQANSDGSYKSLAAAAQARFQMNSPLDALFQMTSSTFDAMKRGEKRKDREAEHHSSANFTNKQTSKKKRKSRTAFTNNQIYELERRFRMQKYLSPTDRDEIAMTLNLSNAQVITWFQNRRAKLKRDLEEQKRDIETASLLNLHKTFLESLQALSQMNNAIKTESITACRPDETNLQEIKQEEDDEDPDDTSSEIDIHDV